jgi:hypothetical protein
LSMVEENAAVHSVDSRSETEPWRTSPGCGSRICSGWTNEGCPTNRSRTHLGESVWNPS